MPQEVTFRFNLGMAFMLSNRLPEASKQFQQVLEVAPDHADAHFRLAVLLEAQGLTDRALKHFEDAVKFRSDWASPVRRIAWIRATSSNEGLRDAEKAITLAERATNLTSRKNPVVLDTLAAAYAAAGRFEDAVSTEEEAVLLSAGKLPPAFVEQMRDRLKLYQKNQPFVHTTQ